MAYWPLGRVSHWPACAYACACIATLAHHHKHCGHSWSHSHKRLCECHICSQPHLRISMSIAGIHSPIRVSIVRALQVFAVSRVSTHITASIHSPEQWVFIRVHAHVHAFTHTHTKSSLPSPSPFRANLESLGNSVLL